MNLLSITSVVIGGLFGFLFGMPKNSHHEEHKKPTNNKKEDTLNSIDKEKYQENTNLQEISDWMTKIIVGVGLTQFRSIYHEYSVITLTISSENKIGSHTIVCMVTIYFYILGFFAAYLWAKLDYNDIINSKLINNKINSISNRTDEIDKKADEINKNVEEIDKRSDERDKINIKILEIASILDSDKLSKNIKNNYLSAINDIVAKNPKHRMANIVLARFYAELSDDYFNAISCLDKYIMLKYYDNEKDMDLSDALYNKAYYLLKLNYIEKSLETLKICFEICPQNKNFAKDDPDLADLHENPIFIDMVK